MLVTIGKIVNMHGIHGEMRILSDSDFANERFAPGNSVTVSNGNLSKTFEVETYRTHKNFHLVKFVGVTNINDVEQYKGFNVLQDETNDAVQLEENEFYYHDIIGCTVFNEGTPIGRVIDIFETGANDVWVVKGEREHLIPYIESVVKKVDVVGKRIDIEAMEGLLNED